MEEGWPGVAVPFSAGQGSRYPDDDHTIYLSTQGTIFEPFPPHDSLLQETNFASCTPSICLLHRMPRSSSNKRKPRTKAQTAATRSSPTAQSAAAQLTTKRRWYKLPKLVDFLRLFTSLGFPPSGPFSLPPFLHYGPPSGLLWHYRPTSSKNTSAMQWNAPSSILAMF